MKQEMEQLQKLAEKYVKYAKDNGADDVQISISSGSNFSVDLREAQIEKLVEAGSTRLALKIIKDSRAATASTSDLNENTLNELTKGAIKRAGLTSQDPNAVLPEKQEIAVKAETLKLYDPKLVEMTAEAKIAIAREIEKKALANPKVKKSEGASVSSGYGITVMANSKGFSGGYLSTMINAGIYLQAGEGELIFEDGWYSASRSLAGIMSSEEIADTAANRVTRLIGARKIKTQNVPVIFEANMTGSILGFLAQCLSGNAVYMKRTFLADKLNQQVAVKNVNIIDNGLLPGGLGSEPFDSEGVPTTNKHIIENGVLKNFLLNTYSAKKLGLQTTGNASGPTNFYMDGGESTLEEMIKSVKKGLLLTKTIGQGTVATTGDISKGAFGLWIENGEIAYPVAEITISGNLGNILNDIEMIGNDLKLNKSIAGPSVKVKQMTISGL